MGFVEVSGGRTKFRPIVDPALVAWTAIAGGAIGLSALRTLTDGRRVRPRMRLRMGKRRIARRLRRLFG
jgi:hypothetical protein